MASSPEVEARFQSALVGLKGCREVTALAEAELAQARSALCAADPNNPMLTMDPEELANLLASMTISPFAALLEIYFGQNEKSPARGGGGMGLPASGAVPFGDILRRIGGGTGLER